MTTEEKRKEFYSLYQKLLDDECVSFNNCKFPCNADWPSHKELIQLAKALETSVNCQFFRLWGTDDGSQLSDDIVSNFAEALKVNRSVTLLTFECHKNFGPDSARSIAELLVFRNTSTDAPITDIRIGWTSIGDEGLEHLTKVLPDLTTMTYLSVNDALITDTGARLLADAVTATERNGGTLANVDFEGNPDITEEGETLVVRSMLRAGIEANRYTSDTAKKILQRLKEQDQKDRIVQDAVLLESLENATAQSKLVMYTHQMFSVIHTMIAGEDAEKSGDEEAENSVQPFRQGAFDLVTSEIERIGMLTAERRKYYSVGETRWDTLKQIRFDNERTFPHCQPVGITNISITRKKLLVANEESKDIYENDEHFKAFVSKLHANTLFAYFGQALQCICNDINDATSISDLGLPQAQLEFLQDKLVLGQKRVVLSMGPIKGLDRALVKTREYQNEIDEGSRPSNAYGRDLNGVDYVLDWLRATITAQDPYLLFVAFLQLTKSRSGKKMFEIQRVKNKFFDESYPTYIQTNVLMNLFLLYPPDESSYNSSGLSFLGPFRTSRAGEPLSSVEVQLTLQDFLTIKTLLHDYYDVERSVDPLCLLRSPLFVDKNTLQPSSLQQN